MILHKNHVRPRKKLPIFNHLSRKCSNTNCNSEASATLQSSDTTYVDLTVCSPQGSTCRCTTCWGCMFWQARASASRVNHLRKASPSGTIFYLGQKHDSGLCSGSGDRDMFSRLGANEKIPTSGREPRAVTRIRRPYYLVMPKCPSFLLSFFPTKESTSLFQWT